MDEQAAIFSVDSEMTTHETAGTVDPNASVLACFKCLKGKNAVEEPVVTFCGHLFCWRCLFEEVPPDRPVHLGVSLSCPVCEHGVVAGNPYKDQNMLIPVYKKTETSEDHVSRCVLPRPAAIGFSVSDLDERTKLIRTAVQRIMNAKGTLISISERNKSVVVSVDEHFKQIMGRFRQKAGLRRMSLSKN